MYSNIYCVLSRDVYLVFKFVVIYCVLSRDVNLVFKFVVIFFNYMICLKLIFSVSFLSNGNFKGRGVEYVF